MTMVSSRDSIDLRPPYMINFIVNNSTLYKVIDRVWAILMQNPLLDY